MTAKVAPLALGTGSAAQVGRVLGITRQTLAGYVEEGKLPKPIAKATYDVQACITAYVELLRGDRKAGTKAAAESGVKLARQREIEQMIAKRGRDLVATNDAIGALDEIVGVFLTELNALPASTTRDRVLRRQLEAKVDGILARVSAALDRAANDVRTGGETDAAEAAEAAG